MSNPHALRKTFPAILAILLTSAVITACGKNEQTAPEKSEEPEGNAVSQNATSNDATVEQAENEAETPGSDEAEFKAGLAAFDQKDYAAAVKSFRAGAEQGNVEAQLMLGHCLLKGLGVRKNVTDAMKWMKKAADSGNQYAEASYGTLLIEIGDPETAAEYLKKSAEQGDLCGQLMLGAIELRDEATAEKGFASLLKLASLPPTDETSIMDHTMKTELGVSFDRDVSFRNAMICTAQHGVGGAYALGKGVKQDTTEGLKWLRKAAEGGMIEAKELAAMLEKTEPDGKPEGGSWTVSNPFGGPRSIGYAFKNCSDERIWITIPNMVYQSRKTKDEVDLELKKDGRSFRESMPLGKYGTAKTMSTDTFYKLGKGRRMTCRVEVYEDDDETLKASHEYKTGLNYPEGFWDKGGMPDIQFFYDGEQLYVSFYDYDRNHFRSCLNDGTPFDLIDYTFYGWFHPDITVREYVKLPESVRYFTQEEREGTVGTIRDLREEYYAASTLADRKALRKKIAEKLKKEYPIR